MNTKKPWGDFQLLTHNEKSTVKIIYIKKGHRTSLQSHQHREELWIVLKGRFKITHNTESFIAIEGTECFIQRNEMHRLEGIDDDNRILEISQGNFDENDIIRFEDDYNRI